jgi:hypothetical protein
LKAGEVKGLSFEVADLREGQLELKLDAKDHLLIDNVAYAAVDPPRQLEVVLVTEGNTALQSALKTPQAASIAAIRTLTSEEMEWDEPKKLAASGSVDLFIYDNCRPSKMPEANTLFLGQAPPLEDWKSTPPSVVPLLIDANRSHPLLQYVDLSFKVVEAISIEPPSGGTELLRTDAGVLMAVAPRDAYQDAVLGMRLKDSNTNWPNRPGFPVFILNALEYLGGAVSSASSKTVRPGQPMITSIASRFSKVAIESPTGKRHQIEREGQPQITFSQTDSPGPYTVKAVEDNRTLQIFTVNLFSERESNIAATPDIRIGLQDVKPAEVQSDSIRAEYWRWLLALGLVVLLVEWYLYNRRVSV